jgi:hypothetical protein
MNSVDPNFSQSDSRISNKSYGYIKNTEYTRKIIKYFAYIMLLLQSALN